MGTKNDQCFSVTGDLLGPPPNFEVASVCLTPRYVNIDGKLMNTYTQYVYICVHINYLMDA